MTEFVSVDAVIAANKLVPEQGRNWLADKYALLPAETMPPIVVDRDFVLSDGRHRTMGAAIAGRRWILANVIERANT